MIDFKIERLNSNQIKIYPSSLQASLPIATSNILRPYAIGIRGLVNGLTGQYSIDNATNININGYGLRTGGQGVIISTDTILQPKLVLNLNFDYEYPDLAINGGSLSNSLLLSGFLVLNIIVTDIEPCPSSGFVFWGLSNDFSNPTVLSSSDNWIEIIGTYSNTCPCPPSNGCLWPF